MLQLVQEQRLELQFTLNMPDVQWSLLEAYGSGPSHPPRYVEPTFEEEVFQPQIKLTRTMIPGFSRLTHLDRLRRIDAANRLFQFVYARGVGSEGRDFGYYKVPLLRNYRIKAEDLRVRINVQEYERATVMMAAVGEFERIARAVPYLGLYQTVMRHLKHQGARWQDTALVSVDRGGRLPCLILQRALDLPFALSLKVNQGSNGDGLDEDQLQIFASRGVVRGKHILFVDSTVDSGRQYRCLSRFLDMPSWQERLGHSGWSLVGSNDCGQNVGPRHQDINWGVDPDRTFEDRPELMGIDYAPGSRTKVVECPSETSEDIRAQLLSVPDGWIYKANDIHKQIEYQRKLWTVAQEKRRAKHEEMVRQEREASRRELRELRRQQKRLLADQQLNRCVDRMRLSQCWKACLAAHHVPYESGALPTFRLRALCSTRRNVLIIGSSQQTFSESAVAYIADTLAPICVLLAGTADGNPGAVLKAAQKVPSSTFPDVRLYQSVSHQLQTNNSPEEIPTITIGSNKGEMRRQMISDAHVVLVLGGREGTLREAVLALEMKKPLLLIRSSGPVADYLLGMKSFSRRPEMIICDSLFMALCQLVARLTLHPAI